MKSQKSNQPIKAHILFNMRSKTWMLSVGLVQGLIQKTLLTIHDEQENEVAKAEITQINPENAQLEIIEGALDKNEAYTTFITDLVDNSLKIFFEGENENFRVLNEMIDERFDNFLLQRTQKHTSAHYILSIEKKCYKISLPNDTRPVVLPLPISNADTLDTLARILWDLSKWHYVKNLANVNAGIPNDTVSIQIFKIEDEADTKKDILLIPNEGKIKLHKKDKVRIAIQNNSTENSFFCAFLGLGTRFDISSDFLEGRIEHLQPNQQTYIWEGDALYLEDVFLEHHTRDNWKEVEFHLKLIISLEPFDSYIFESPGVPVPYGDTEQYNLIRMIRRRTYFAPEDWTTSQVTIVIKNPDYQETNKSFSNLVNRIKSNFLGKK